MKREKQIEALKYQDGIDLESNFRRKKVD